MGIVWKAFQDGQRGYGGRNDSGRWALGRTGLGLAAKDQLALMAGCVLESGGCSGGSCKVQSSNG